MGSPCKDIKACLAPLGQCLAINCDPFQLVIPSLKCMGHDNSGIVYKWIETDNVWDLLHDHCLVKLKCG